MYAVDSRGLTTAVLRNIMPKTRSVQVNSDPSGLQVLIDEFPVVTTPMTITTWARHNLRLDVSDQPPNMVKSWSDGGACSHPKKIVARNGTVTRLWVTFAEGSSLPPLTDPVRECCSSQNRCRRCKGHCQQSHTECQSGLVCHNKSGTYVVK
jgi:hypothetical protein